MRSDIAMYRRLADEKRRFHRTIQVQDPIRPIVSRRRMVPNIGRNHPHAANRMIQPKLRPSNPFFKVGHQNTVGRTDAQEIIPVPIIAVEFAH